MIEPPDHAFNHSWNTLHLPAFKTAQAEDEARKKLHMFLFEHLQVHEFDGTKIYSFDVEFTKSSEAIVASVKWSIAGRPPDSLDQCHVARILLAHLAGMALEGALRSLTRPWVVQPTDSLTLPQKVKIYNSPGPITPTDSIPPVTMAVLLRAGTSYTIPQDGELKARFFAQLVSVLHDANLEYLHHKTSGFGYKMFFRHNVALNPPPLKMVDKRGMFLHKWDYRNKVQRAWETHKKASKPHCR